MYKKILTFGLLLGLIACQPAGDSQESSFSLDYEKFQLKNGLEVILHLDQSDPHEKFVY